MQIRLAAATAASRVGIVGSYVADPRPSARCRTRVVSNRRRLASEKALRVRCPRCRGREFATKVFEDHDERVCLSCEHIVRVPHES